MGIKNSYKSFTLIEVIVVVGTVSLLLPILFNILFILFNQQLRIKKLAVVKREGDYILNQLKNNIENYAVSIHNETNNEICRSNTIESITFTSYFKTKFNSWFRYYLDSSNKIASQSSQISSTIFLNSDSVKIENFSLTCYRTNNFSPPIIIVNFDICYNDNYSNCNAPGINYTKFNYRRYIKLKSY